MKSWKIEEAKQWLVDNLDKWENYIEFKFLVPVDQVPPVVLEYIKFEEESEKYWDEVIELLK